VDLVFHIFCAAFSSVNILWRDSRSHGLISGQKDHGREHQIFVGGVDAHSGVACRHAT